MKTFPLKLLHCLVSSLLLQVFFLSSQRFFFQIKFGRCSFISKNFDSCAVRQVCVNFDSFNTKKIWFITIKHGLIFNEIPNSCYNHSQDILDWSWFSCGVAHVCFCRVFCQYWGNFGFGRGTGHQTMILGSLGTFVIFPIFLSLTDLDFVLSSRRKIFVDSPFTLITKLRTYSYNHLQNI